MPLTAAEILASPAFADLNKNWQLEPAKSGKCAVAQGRGGPFDLWYEVHGTGNVKVVFIMGLGSFCTSWKRQTKYFGHQQSTRYSSLVFDNRGMGRSDKPTCRYSTSEMARDAIELLDFLGWTKERSLHIVGVSMGGMIAQELGLLIPSRIASLSLVSTAPRLVRTVPFVENLRQRINMFVPRAIDVQLDEVAHRLFSTPFLEAPDSEATHDPATGAVVEGFPTNFERFAAAEITKRSDTEGFTRKGFMLQAIAAGWHHKTAEQLKQLGDKVGRERIAVLHGTGDRMLTFLHGELLKEELGEGIEWRVWQGRGHVLMWEVEDEFNECVKGFVDRCEGMKKA